MLVGLSQESWVLGIGIAVFTLLSGFASVLLLVLNFMNGQYFNYVSILAIVISLDKFNGVFQQLYTITNFREIQQKSYEMAIAYFKCRGTEDLPLFTAPDATMEISITIYQFLLNTQGMLFFYWSLVLFSSSWSLQPAWWKNQKIVAGTKVSCLIVPIILAVLIRFPAINQNDIANLLVMNIIVLLNIGMGSVFLLLTLFHVVSVHRQARGGTEIRLSRRYDGVIEYHQRDIQEKEETTNFFTAFRKFGTSSDGWLVARIALAFVMVEGLQIYAIVMQIFYLNRWSHFKLEWQKGLSAPDIDQAEELANLCSPIPASFTGFLFFFVFGTTVESRLALGRLFRAMCFWRKQEEEKRPSFLPERRPSKLQKSRRNGSESSASSGMSGSTRAGSRATQGRGSPSVSNISLAETGQSPTSTSLLEKVRLGSFSSSTRSPRRPSKPSKILSILTPSRHNPPTQSPASATASQNPFATPTGSRHNTPTPTGERTYPAPSRDTIDSYTSNNFPFDNYLREPSQENSGISALSTYSFNSRRNSGPVYPVFSPIGAGGHNFDDTLRSDDSRLPHPGQLVMKDVPSRRQPSVDGISELRSDDGTFSGRSSRIRT